MRLIADLPYAARENACFDLYLPDAETFDLVTVFMAADWKKEPGRVSSTRRIW